jgi:6-phosphogluconolactonase
VDFAPDNRFALSCDLGLDQIFVYPFDSAAGNLLSGREVNLAPGAGPRHAAFHPTGTRVYIINELDSTMAVFAYAADSGAMTLLQTLSTLPEGHIGWNAAAEVCVHASGNFVYGSNRGHDSIVIYAVEASGGLLNTVGHEPVRGKTPRHIAVDPSGTTLLAANQDSNTVTRFRIDEQTGRLQYLHTLELSKPVCLKFWSGGKTAGEQG